MRVTHIVGSDRRAASREIWPRRLVKKVFEPTITARASLLNKRREGESRSFASPPLTTRTCTPRLYAASSMSFASSSVSGFVGLTRTAIGEALGTISCGNPSRLEPNRAVNVAAWPIEADDEAYSDRVVPGREDDWN